MKPEERAKVIESLETLAQAIREVQHAQNNGPSWYTRGANGLYMQVAAWCRRGASAAQEALAILQKEGPAEASPKGFQHPEEKTTTSEHGNSV